MIYWKCEGCGKTIQGVLDADGDFISDKSLDEQTRGMEPATGCYLCGSELGTEVGEVEEEDDLEWK
jgi:hypothetical protein